MKSQKKLKAKRNKEANLLLKNKITQAKRRKKKKMQYVNNHREIL